MSTDAMRSCPYCGELIKTAAVKCRFCGEYVDAPRRAEPARGDQPSGDEVVQFIIPVNVSGWSLVACYAGIIGFCLPVIGLIFAIPAVICGIIALRRRKKAVTYGHVTGDIRAVIGLVLGSLGVLVWGAAAVIMLLVHLGILK